MSAIEGAYLFLIVAGTFGSLSFVLDYVRMADLRQPISRQLLALNLAMGSLLLLSLIRGLLNIPRESVLFAILTLFFFIVIDVSIFYQWYLMRQARRRRRGEDERLVNAIVNAVCSECGLDYTHDHRECSDPTLGGGEGGVRAERES